LAISPIIEEKKAGRGGVSVATGLDEYWELAKREKGKRESNKSRQERQQVRAIGWKGQNGRLAASALVGGKTGCRRAKMSQSRESAGHRERGKRARWISSCATGAEVGARLPRSGGRD